MCPAIPISAIYGAGSDNWNASAYAALSIASKVSAAVRAQGAIISLTREVWKLDGVLRNFLGDIYKAAENPPPVPQEPVTEEAVLEAAKTLRRLHGLIDQVYLRAKSGGLTNRRFTGAAINSVKVRAEEMLEIAEALELSLNPHVDAILSQSLEDLHNGNVHDLPTFK
jgi:hypothetical protein